MHCSCSASTNNNKSMIDACLHESPHTHKATTSAYSPFKTHDMFCLPNYVKSNYLMLSPLLLWQLLNSLYCSHYRCLFRNIALLLT